MAEDKTKSKKTNNKKSDKKKSSKNPFKSIGSFFKSVRSEGKKVVWPKGNEVLKNSLVVVVVILIVGVIIFGIDEGLTLGMKGIKSLKPTTTVASNEAMDSLSDILSGETEKDTTEATTSAETTATATTKAAE